jgi:hypothetical protein
MNTKISVKAEFDPHKIEIKGHEPWCVAAVGYQLLHFAGITPPEPQEIDNAYRRSGNGNGFRFLSTFIEENFPQLEAKHEANDKDTYLQKCSEILGKKIPVGISPGLEGSGDPGHVAVLVAVDNQEETLVWWEAQLGKYITNTKEDFVKRNNHTFETFYLVKKSNSF